MLRLLLENQYLYLSFKSEKQHFRKKQRQSENKQCFSSIDRQAAFRYTAILSRCSASSASLKTFRPKSNRRRRRDGVHDACGEERLGYLQLAAHLRRAREGWPRPACAEGIGVAFRGADDVAPRAAESSSLGAGNAIAVVLPRAAVAGLTARGARQPKGFG